MTTVLAPAYSQPSTYGGPAGRVHHGYSTAKADEITVPLDLSKPLRSAWYAKLEPGGFIVPHVDQGPWRERWHYPISGTGIVWQSWEETDGPTDRVMGYLAPQLRLDWFTSDKPYRMNHHLPHAIWNPHDEPRIILIVEFDNPVDQPTSDLILAPMIPQVQELIDAV